MGFRFTHRPFLRAVIRYSIQGIPLRFRLWGDALHSLKGLPHVMDIRNIGLVGAVELEPIAGEPAKRAFSAFVECYEQGITIRTTGDIIAMSPPLIIEKGQIDFLIDKLASVIKGLN